MFEGKPLRPSEAHPLGDDQWGDGPLRPLSWSDLVSRLSRVRDMRQLRVPSAAPDEACEASFDADFARRIAAHHSGKQNVNPDVSGNGKGRAGTAWRAVRGAEPGAMRK